MKYILNDIEYDVVIEKKNNKNTYLRVKDNKILITTNYFVTKHQILKFLRDNEAFIIKNIKRMERHKELEEKFMLLGKEYNVILSRKNK